MYRLVIVEDERDVRKRIVGLIETSGDDFEIVGEYENGIDAYDGIQTDNPDLIITDIKIPYISGIELIQKVRSLMPVVKVIVITGYNEFDYAKQAANLNVIGFVSKPVTAEDVRIQLGKAKELLDSEYLTSKSLDQLETFYKNSLPLIRENDLYRLSTMTDISPAYEKKLRYSEVSLDFRYFAMGILDFDKSNENDPEQLELTLAPVREMLADSFRDCAEIETFRRFETLCLILKFNRLMEISDIERRLTMVVERVGRYSDMPLSAGLSRIYENNRDFASMRKEARRALGYRSVMGGGRVFYYGDVLSGAGANVVINDNEINELGYLLRFKSSNECIDALRHIRQKVESVESHNSYYYMLTAILNTLVKASDNLPALFDHYSGRDGIYQRLFEIKTADGAFLYLENLAKLIRKINDEVIVSSVERNLKKVVDYMQAHYCDADLNFDKLSDDTGLSVSYISALLKKNMNTSFVKYLTALRVERAKELLGNPALKIIDIAEQLGYNDSYYFSHCFKKYTGDSPKEFRNHE